MKELSEGVSMMKKRKLFTTLLTLLLLFVFIAPTMAKAVEGTNGIAQTLWLKQLKVPMELLRLAR